MTIKNWSKEDQPSERLQSMGVDSLTNGELLSIIIGSGTSKATAVELGNGLLEKFNFNLGCLAKATCRELTDVNGIGIMTACRIMAAIELGRRRQVCAAMQKKDLGSAVAIYEHMRPLMADLDVEEAWIILMNQNYKLIKSQRISHGGITETAVDIRIVMREAILANATILALCHNHPSNNPSPSSDDDRLTQRVKKACETMRIYFLDHLIICDGQYYSYAERGRL
ncbi:MAG: DNA repair protein RadC [Bacteroidales bacterium]|nr:DNA repair protein RadC [Bacteroidales bacterium]